MLGQLRELVTDPNAPASRKLPAAEREHRMTESRRRLNGVVLLEAMQQKESNQFTYVQLDRCTSRAWEITMGKSEKQLSLDSEKLVVKERADIPDQYHSSKLQAMACANILSWECHDRYLQQLKSHLRLDPPQNYTNATAGFESGPTGLHVHDRCWDMAEEIG